MSEFQSILHSLPTLGNPSRGEWDYESNLLNGSVYGVLDRREVEAADRAFNGLIAAAVENHEEEAGEWS